MLVNFAMEVFLIVALVGLPLLPSFIKQLSQKREH